MIHESGHIYGCLKPTSVRVSGEELRLAHFGLGMVEQEHARIRGPIQEQLSPAEHVLCRSASDQRRYVSPEIFQGGEPLPSDDLYALGVLWSQLLLGDIATSISLDDLKSVQAPDQVSIIQACLGPRDQRPRHAGDLLSLLQMSGVAQPTTTRTESSILTADDIREMRASQKRLLGQARELLDAHEDLHEVTQDCQRRTLRWLLIGSLATLGMLVAFLWRELAGVAWLLLLLPILTVVLISRHGRSQIRAAEVELERRISQLEIEYPDEMQGWGGASILRNRELVREMVGTLETDMGIINVP